MGLNLNSRLLDWIGEKCDKELEELEAKKRNRKPIVNLYKEHWDNHIACSECSTINDKKNNYCLECGHKLKKITDENINRKYCPICGEKVSMDMDYCSKYGHEVKLKGKINRCVICGEWIDEERYCINCGHDNLKRSPFYDVLGTNRHDLKNIMKCPNCGRKYKRYFHYCYLCGEKLIKYRD